MRPARTPTLPQGPEKARMVREMFDAIAPRYDLLNRLISLGLDAGWRRRAVAALGLPPASRVADLACGTGDLCRELARAGLRPVGLDFSPGMLAAARTTAPLVRADIQELPVRSGALDGAVCGFALRNLTDLSRFAAELARAVRPGGRIALLEVGRPEGRLVRAGNALWFGRVVPRLGGLLSDPTAYRYLPRSVGYLPPAEELVGLFRRAGFSGVQRHALSGGLAELIVGTRRR
jgi:demethylmenaquinone methyltransferase/2-methoxy-6-polyprenyl-1,4-benzoquinol methylase